MIFDAIIEFFLAPIRAILSALPTIGFSLPDGVFNSIVDTCAFIGYVLPINSICICLSLRISLHIARATIAYMGAAKRLVKPL